MPRNENPYLQNIFYHLDSRLLSTEPHALNYLKDVCHQYTRAHEYGWCFGIIRAQTKVTALIRSTDMTLVLGFTVGF